MKEADIPLVRGGKLTKEMIAWIDKVSKHFPGVEKELVTIRKPISASPREWEKVTKARETERKQDDRNQERANTDEW
jgi:hypothetical protein